MCIFQLLTRFTCINSVFSWRGYFCLLFSLLSLTKTGQSECNILVYVRRDRTGVNYYCDVTSSLFLGGTEKASLVTWPYCFNILDSNVLFTERKLRYSWRLNRIFRIKTFFKHMGDAVCQISEIRTEAFASNKREKFGF